MKRDLAERLHEAQAGLESITRDAIGDTGGHKYPYATLASVMDSVRGPLAAAGLFIRHSTYTPNGLVGVRTYITSIKGDSDSVYIEIPLPEDARNMAHAIGSAISYGRRYGVLTILGIATATDDDDGAALGNRQTAQQAPPPDTREPREDGQELVTRETWDELLRRGRQMTPAQRAAMNEWKAERDERLKWATTTEESAREAVDAIRRLMATQPVDLDDEDPADLPGQETEAEPDAAPEPDTPPAEPEPTGEELAIEAILAQGEPADLHPDLEPVPDEDPKPTTKRRARNTGA